MFILSRTVAAGLRSLAARKRISKTEIARQIGLPLTTVQRSFAAARRSAASLLVMGIGVVIAYLKVVQSKISAQLKDLHRGVSEVGDVVESVKDQTHNDHPTNLCDDIDALGGELVGVSELLADVAHTQQLQGQEISAHGKVLAQLQAAQ